MRKLTGFAIAVCGGLFLTAGQAEDVTRTGDDALALMQKMTCGTTEAGKTRYGIFEGRVYSRVPGEKDRHLFNVLGINTRQCAMPTDAERGQGYRSVSREIMVYLDPKTKEIVDTWRNPWTGKRIEVLHVANDPVNMRAARYATNDEGKPASVTVRRYGDMVASSSEVPLFYTNPLGGEYQDYVGGHYHAMEIFNTYYPAREFLNDRDRSLSVSYISWQRVAQWLPWLQMGSKPGLMVFNATGFSTFDDDEIPDKLVEILNERYPDYLTPPPLDDARPNETSWTVFQKAMAEKAED